ncbi:MAG: glycoside hydrolase family 127 protein [Fimbriimonadaceae bacterium]|nr:glycoside hydrolase family 127 protein [Fimbriimonadaceae bacterium]
MKPLEPVPFTSVAIHDRFWTPRQETNRTATVDHSLAMLEKAGNLVDMDLAAKGAREGFQGLLFTDSDLYKVLEGISYTLATHPNPALSARLDAIIAKIAAAQQADGYLDTWFQVTRPDQKWTNLRDHHELYCAGHLIEAAVAHNQATGKRNLLDVAVKLATLIDSRYGPGKSAGYPGHPELELALVKLWRLTGEQRWFALSQKFVETRGTGFFAEEHNTPKDRYDGTYWLDDTPICDHEEIKGHAVRAAYLMSGAADVARETQNPQMIAMLDRLWRNTTERRTFVTGGIGPSGSNEGFTVDYDLPNRTAYQETCASVALALWGHRMALLHADARYMDWVERALYNGVPAGVALDGKSFFYVNPLASMGTHHRSEWFACACCPPNVLRTVASIGGYAYATSADEVFVNLYAPGTVDLKLPVGPVHMAVEGDYPWDGHLKFKVEPAKTATFALNLRIPGWARSFELGVNGKPVAATPERGYVRLQREWRAGDLVTLNLPMPVEQIEANPAVKQDQYRTAIQRGPIVYCLEQVDNSVPLRELVIPRGTKLEASWKPDLLGGVVAITGEAERTSEPDWTATLYQPVRVTPTTVTAVPYAVWDNRKAGPMEVWMPSVAPPARVGGPEVHAEVSLSFTSGNAQPWGVNDGLEPKASGEQPESLCHFWPHKGGEEWVQYTWKKPVTAKGVRVYWFDDTGRGECRLPQSWKLQRLQDGKWVDVPATYPVQIDQWTEVKFPALTTTALRLVVQMQKGWAAGIHEWRILE